MRDDDALNPLQMTAVPLLRRLQTTVTACSGRGDARRRGGGFSLVEIAIALAIIAFLVGTLLIPLQSQVEQRQIGESEKALAEITEAVLGFALAKGYLPCPDKTTSAGAGTANDGLEDVSSGICTSAEGNVPWVTLGVDGTDPWGNRYRYRVVPAFSNQTILFTLSSTPDLRVCTTSACTTELTSATTPGSRAVAVILSHGKNGYGAINSITGAANPPPPASNVDEQANSNADTTFVSRTITPAGSAAGEFDDIVTWLSRNTLFSRMIAANKLP